MKSKLIENNTGSLRLVESKELRKGCIGRLEGPCADFLHPTRNDRLYGLQLWKNVFNNELFKESIETKTAFGELDHPEDRFEVLSKLACVVMTDYNIDEKQGIIYGGFDILNTPQGKILKALMDYGCQMGVSSRGTGDIIETDNGEEVDPDTYEFSCFDVVSTPAVAKARQTYTESMEMANRKRVLTESIKTEINNCNSVEELNAINNTINQAKVPNLHSLAECIEDKKENLKCEGKTISSQVDSMLNVKSNLTSTKTIRDMDRKTFKQITETVYNLNSKVNAYKVRERNLTKLLNSYVEQLNMAQSEISELNEQVRDLTNSKKAVSEKVNKLKNDNKQLRENVKQNAQSNNKLDNRIDILNEELTVTKNKFNSMRTQLQESNNKIKESDNIISSYKDKQIQLRNQIKDLKNQISNSNRLMESYKSKEEDYLDNIADLESKLSQAEDTISSYINKEQSLTEQLDRQDENYQYQLDEISESHNTLLDNNDILQERVDNLEEEVKQYRTTNNEISQKYNKLLEAYRNLQNVNASYKTTYLKEYSNKQGVDPNSIKSLIKESTTPSDIKKMVDDVRDKQDRYSKLPISYNKPTTLNVLKEHITSTDNLEGNDTLNFLTAVVDNL